MPCPRPLCQAILLLSLCLQLQCRLPAAAPLLPPPGGEVPPGEMQGRALPESDLDAASHEDPRGDLFPDVDPKALAAVLLQALHLRPGKPNEGHADLEPGANEERVRSETKSADVQSEGELGWRGWEAGGQSPEEETPDRLEAETLESLLQELQRYSPTPHAAAPAPPGGVQGDVLQELEEYEPLRVHSKRKAPSSEPWEGARKLRQQQHLEHQLLQRRYEELAESRRQAEEARRAAAEEERLADMASDLLLQYLLKDGEESEEEKGPGSKAGGQKAGSALLFEDEESNVAEDKRSNEAPEGDDDEDIDPNTIDRLIELSSKLHLPADDVIDIINDVEKKKKEEVQEAPSKGKAPATPAPRDKPPKTPPRPAYRPGQKASQKPYRPPAQQPPRRLPKEDEDAWNEVLRGDEYPAPKWLRAQPSNVLSSYISPRTFPPPAHHRYAHLMMPQDEEEEDRARDEELENYIERALLERPRGF